MKFLFTLMCMTALLFGTQAVNAQSKQPITNKLLPPPPEDPGGGGGGGGGGGPTVTGGIIYSPYSLDYNFADVSVLGYEDNGPNFNNNELKVAQLLYHFQTRTFVLNGGILNDNDEMRSAQFRGVLAGRVFEFYDNSSVALDKSDDWTSVTFKQELPTNYQYQLWTLENSYEDAYVKVVYHPHNGLDGKVSLIHTYPTL